MKSSSERSLFYIAGFNSGGPALTPIRSLFKQKFTQYKSTALSSSSIVHSWFDNNLFLSHVINKRLKTIKTISKNSHPLFIAHSLGCIELLRDLNTLIDQDTYTDKHVDLVLISPPNLLQAGNGLKRLYRMSNRFLTMQYHLADNENVIFLENSIAHFHSAVTLPTEIHNHKVHVSQLPLINKAFYSFLKQYDHNNKSKLLYDLKTIDQKLTDKSLSDNAKQVLIKSRSKLLKSFSLGLFHGEHLTKQEHAPILKENGEHLSHFRARLLFSLNFPIGFVKTMLLMKDIDKLLIKLTHKAHIKNVKLSLRFIFFQRDQLVPLADLKNIPLLKSKLNKNTELKDSIIFSPSSHSTLIYNSKILETILKLYF